MPSIKRKSRLEKTIASFPNAALTSVTLKRPTSGPEFRGNVRDHVADNPYVEDFHGGKVAVELPATLDIAGVSVRKIEIVDTPRRSGPDSSNTGGNPQGSNVIGVDFVAQQGEALFPTGSTAEATEVIFEDATGVPLGGAATDVIHRLLKESLMIGASQSVRLHLFNNSGGALNNQAILAYYGLGLADGDYSLQDIN